MNLVTHKFNYFHISPFSISWILSVISQQICTSMFSSLLLSLIDSSRVYRPPDPPGYFDGHVWPMYLKNKQEMQKVASGISKYLV